MELQSGRKIRKPARQREEHTGHKGWAQEIRHTVIGDFGFADDTAIVGLAEEALLAEQILAETARDWEEKCIQVSSNVYVSAEQHGSTLARGQVAVLELLHKARFSQACSTRQIGHAQSLGVAI